MLPFPLTSANHWHEVTVAAALRRHSHHKERRAQLGFHNSQVMESTLNQTKSFIWSHKEKQSCFRPKCKWQITEESEMMPKSALTLMQKSALTFNRSRSLMHLHEITKKKEKEKRAYMHNASGWKERVSKLPQSLEVESTWATHSPGIMLQYPHWWSIQENHLHKALQQLGPGQTWWVKKSRDGCLMNCHHRASQIVFPKEQPKIPH